MLKNVAFKSNIVRSFASTTSKNSRFQTQSIVIFQRRTLVACKFPVIFASRLKNKLPSIFLNTFKKRLYSVKNMTQVKDFVSNKIENCNVIIFSKTTCPFCKKAKEYFNAKNVEYETFEFNMEKDGDQVREYFTNDLKLKTVPQIYVNGYYIGGSDDLLKQDDKGLIDSKLSLNRKEFDYDVVVIGGGSGGLAASSRAASYGFRVAVVDFVQPTPQNYTWGVGGTCVNVGCIPKKLWHTSSIHREQEHFGDQFGWENEGENRAKNFNFETLATNIQNHIKSLNYGYRTRFIDEKIKYFNALGVFQDRNTLKLTFKNGNKQRVKANYFIIATGGRPTYPDNLGLNARKLCITSDDLFWLKKPPGKTLVIGASYIALECSGFLAQCGFKVDVLVRSILLRGFDQQIAEFIYENMKKVPNLTMYRPSIPVSIEESTNENEADASKKRIRVTSKNTETGETRIEEYDTVVFAIGRYPLTRQLALDNLGIKMDKNGFILDTDEKTNVNNIYAIGDVLHAKPQLTPVAIKAGQTVIDRIFTKSQLKINYTNVATTVFTPVEYGAIGLSEEEAIEKLGHDNVEVYHSKFTPLEWKLDERSLICYVKLICDKSQNERIVGFHYLGPNAGEVTQGYAVAMKLGATKDDFDNTVGIHPTCSEVLLSLTVTKRSGKDFGKSGC